MSRETQTESPEWFGNLSEEVRARLGASDQTILFSLEQLGERLEADRSATILAVVDRFVIEQSSVAPIVRSWLRAENVVLFDSIAPNPSLESVEEAARVARQAGASVVLAIGGGSAIDSAKLAAMGASDAQWADRVREQQSVADLKSLPLIAVPTTSGSGSEATPFAVVYLGAKKLSVAHPQIRPETVVLEPRLAMEMPARLAAVTGLDALSQSLESFWAVGSTDRSRSDAQMALQIIEASLELSVRQPTRELRALMLVAAHLAGCAIAVGKTTAAHAISYTITKRWNVPHGLAVALTLGHVAAWNAGVSNDDCIDSRGADHVREQVECGAQCLDSRPTELPRCIRDWLRRLGLPASLSEAGVPIEELSTITSRVDPVRLGNNPRRFTVESMDDMLHRAWPSGEDTP